ncbi:hypothetical protein FQN54_007369 [Arachnomyces sp. PD_36]|nr:hypothetical protein FQN54_007369 [Arachnomyces sp. PD_36]
MEPAAVQTSPLAALNIPAAAPSPSKVDCGTKHMNDLMDLKASLKGLERVSFNAGKHLEHTPPTKIYSMKELGYSEGSGVSPIGVSEPFPLFSAEAIEQMRIEILGDDVLKGFQYSSGLAQCQLRGFAPKHAPFIYDAWKSPETLAIISEIAGIELVPAMDWEIGHVNISVQPERQKNNNNADAKPIVDWHTDSYPFVVVTMLSDCSTMVGGETALRKGDGEVMKVRGPQMVSIERNPPMAELAQAAAAVIGQSKLTWISIQDCAVVLQGRYIEHQALRALGGKERITMVTSFRPRSPMLPDDTVLTTVRPVSDLSELYFQFAEYRLEILEERIRGYLKEMRDKRRAHRPFNTNDAKRFIAEQENFLVHMNNEIVEDSKVKMGVIDDSHLISDDLKELSRKRALDDLE